MSVGSANRSNSGLLVFGRAVPVLQSKALRLRRDRGPALRKMYLPALYGCRMADALCLPGWHDDWSTATPGPRLAMVVGVGHMLPLKHPDAIAGVIEHWIPGNREALHV